MAKRGAASWAFAWLGAGLSLALAGTAAAQDAPPAGDVEKRLRDLERKNEALEKSNDALRDRVATLEGPRAQPAPVSSAAPASAAKPESTETEGEDSAGAGLGLTARYGIVRANLQTFGNFDFTWVNPHTFAFDIPHTSDKGNHAFVQGALDLCPSFAAGDHFHSLAEVVLEGDSVSGDVGIDLERLWGKWAFNDLLYLKAGVEHSPLSRFDRLYHHGRWMWLGATHPFLAEFEDEGGLLPIHQTGVEAGGRFDTPAGVLEYVLAVSNGRARTDDFRSRIYTNKKDEAWDVGLSWSPAFFPELIVGGDFHADEIPTVPGDPARRLQMRELIGEVFVELHVKSFELLAEVVDIAHEDRVTNRTYEHRCGYVQAGYKIGDFTPYVRFDSQIMAVRDPFYSPNDRDLSRWAQHLGVRWDILEMLALKLEGSFGRDQVRNDATGSRSRSWFGTIDAQLAWVF